MNAKLKAQSTIMNLRQNGNCGIFAWQNGLPVSFAFFFPRLGS